jgi:hypothetical protein
VGPRECASCECASSVVRNNGGHVRNGGGGVRNAGGGGAPLCTPVNRVLLCHAELLKNIHSLDILWTEYAIGLGGRKPVREFSSHKHSLKCNKFTFSHRKSRSFGSVFSSTLMLVSLLLWPLRRFGKCMGTGLVSLIFWLA